MASALKKNNAPLIIKYKRTNLKEQRKSFKKYYDALSKHKKLVFQYILDMHSLQNDLLYNMRL